MEEFIKKIYRNMICYEKDAVAMGKRIEKEITDVICSTKGLSKEETEELKNLMYQVAFTAEQEGFCLGVKYTLKMVVGLLGD